MRCRNVTVMTQPQGQHGQCSATSLRSRAVLRGTEVMCIVHVTPMHYGMVIALKQSSRVDLIWCDSLQWNGRQALHTYSQYYHFLETEMNRPQVFQPTRHYSSDLAICTHNLKLSRQHNGTDCGIFSLLYQQTTRRWYGTAA
jgi:Ulp1 family protease